VTYLVVGATWSQRETGKRCLERFTDELRFLEVESDTVVALCAVIGIFGELLRADDVFHSNSLQEQSVVFHGALSELRGTVGKLRRADDVISLNSLQEQSVKLCFMEH